MVASIIMARYLPEYCSQSITAQVIIKEIKDDSPAINQQDDSLYKIFIVILILAFIFLLATYPTQVVLYGWAVIAFFAGISLLAVISDASRGKRLSGICIWSIMSIIGTIFVWWVFTQTLSNPTVMHILYGQGTLAERLISQSGADMVVRTVGVFFLALSLVCSLLQAIFLFFAPLAFTNDFWYSVILRCSGLLTRNGILTHLGSLLFAFFLIKYGINFFMIIPNALNK